MVINTDNNNADSSYLEIPSIDLQIKKMDQQHQEQQQPLTERPENRELENSDEQSQQRESNNDNTHRTKGGQQNISTNESRPTDVNRYKGPKIWRAFVKNWPIISQPVALLIVFFITWATAYSIIPEYVAADSTLMRLAYLFIGAQICGFLAAIILLPDMLGMLSWGVLYANIGYGEFPGFERFEAFLRDMALVNIMLLAGFGLDVKAFKKLYTLILRLSILPSVVEVAVIIVLSYFLLQMPWLWGFLLGLVVTAVSPNVVVTVMLKLQEERLGLNNGIHTLIYATTTCNDVLSIFFFGIILRVIFSTGDLTEQLLQGPVGIGIGIVFGFLYGLLILYLPSRRSKYANEMHFMMTLLGGTISVIGSKAIEYPSAGALGCVMIPFVAKIGWSRQNRWKENVSIVEMLNVVWKFLKPISFALIGKEINFSILDPKIVAYGIIIILVSSLFRLLMGYLCTCRSRELTWKERAYITISGLPKATVQAAIGAVALDMSRSLKSVETHQMATNVLIISALAIISTAPLGALLMIRLAPILLRRSVTDIGVEPATSGVASIDLEQNYTDGHQGLAGKYKQNRT